ncbi:MAG: cytochrome c3 family protein [Fidelibacterota bacterium]
MIGAVFGVTYFGSPKFTDVGYRPVQPVPYSHKLHAGDLGMDCRYCHVAVEIGPKATVPPVQTCMNCHQLILPESVKLKPVRDAWINKTPLEWIRIHKTPDYAFFNHSAHIKRGVGCRSCHGRIDQMDVVMQVQPLSMGWCLDCHRNPDMHLRPLDQITNMEWLAPENQLLLADQYKDERNIKPPTDCTGCHR